MSTDNHDLPPTPEVEQTPPTPQVIRELKNYFPFTHPFGHCHVRRDSFIGDNRAIGVFTSGGDCSGTEFSLIRQSFASNTVVFVVSTSTNSSSSHTMSLIIFKC